MSKRSFPKLPPPAWGMVPLLYAVLAFGAGILFADGIGPTDSLYWLLAALVTAGLTALSVVFRSPARWPAVVGSGGVLLTLFLLAGWRTNAVYLPQQANYFVRHLDQKDLLVGQVATIRPGDKTLRLEVFLSHVLDDSLRQHPVRGKVLVYVPPTLQAGHLESGDELVFAGQPSPLRPPLNPYVFDLSAYWARQQVYHNLFLRDDASWRATGAGRTGLRARAEGWRRAWFGTFQRYLVGDELAVAAALVMGKRDGISQEVKSAYADTGAIHVLAVSGLHVGIIFLIVRTLLTRVFRWGKSPRGKWAVAVLSTLAVWTFALVSGFSPSVQRAAIMFTVLALSGVLRQRTDIFNTLSAAALLMLWFDPNYLFQVGFQLSFTAIIGIVLFTRIINRLLFLPTKLLRSAWSAVAASTGAQLGTLPLSLFHFGRFPTYFFVSGTVVIVSAFAAMFGGLLHGVVGGIWSRGVLPALTGWLLGTIVSVQNALIFYFRKLPYALLEVRHFDELAAVLLALAIGALAVWLRWGGRRWLFGSVLALLCCIVWVWTLTKQGGAAAQVPGRDPGARLIVYHLSRSTLMDVTVGDSAFALGEPPSPERLPWTAGPRREALAYQPEVTLSLSNFPDTLLHAKIDLRAGHLYIGDTRWFVLDGNRKYANFSGIEQASHLLVTNGFRPADFPTPETNNSSIIIIDGSNPYYRWDGWRKLADTTDREIWLTGERGAYEWPADQ